MKKGLILTTALAMVLGVGVVVGTHHAEARQVKAYGPSDTTWYVAGTHNSWNLADVHSHLTYSKTTNNNWEFESDEYIQFAKDDEFKIVYSWNSGAEANYYGPQLMTNNTDFTGGNGNNVKAARDIKVKFFFQVYGEGASWTGLYWEEYEEPEPDHVYSYRVNSGTVVEMEEGTGTEYVSVERSFDKYDSVEFLKDGVLMEVTPKDLVQLTKLYVKSPTKLEFAENYSGALYLDVSANTVWAGQFTPGYYLAGVGDNWQPKLGVPAVAHEDSFLVSNIHLTADTEVKFVKAPENGAFDWKSADPAKFTKGDGVSASVVSSAGEGNGNLKIEETGDYDLYYTPESQWVSIYNYVAPPADPVYTVTCEGSTPYEFVLDEEDKPEGVVHQYRADVQFCSRTRQLVFFKDGEEITSGIGADQVDNNNIYGDVTNGFRIYHTYNYSYYTKIYLKTYSDGGISVWGEGYEENTYRTAVTQINGTKKTVYLTVDETYEANETYIKQYKTSEPVSIKALSGMDWDHSYGIDCSGLSEYVGIENVAGNNAMRAFQGTAWKVHNDCEQVIYLKESKSDLTLYMYIGGYEASHVLTIGGQNVTMTKYDENQYRAVGVTLSAGDTVTSYTIEGVAQTVTSKVVGNNNLTEDMKVIADAVTDIYYNVNTKTLFVGGIPDIGYHVLLNDHTLVAMVHTDPYDEFDQYMSASVTFAVNDTIKVVNATAAEGAGRATIWAITTIEDSEEGSNFEVVDGVIKCKTACTTKVYLKLKFEQDRIYFGSEDQYITEAREFANGFASAMATACSATSGKQATVEAAWAAQATAFAGLSAEAKAELKLGDLSSVLEVRQFGQRYVAIKQQHSDWTLANFLEWEIPASSTFAPTSEQNSVSQNANILIIIVAAISVVSLAALIVIKKRKHN